MKKLLLLISAGLCVSAYASTSTDTSSSVTSDSVTTSTTTTTSSVNSNENGTYNTGGYGEAQFGSANSSGLNSGVNNAGAFRVDAGYKINAYGGIEAGATFLDKPTAGQVTAGLQFYDVSAKGYLPLTSWFDLHGQVGLAYANMNAQTVNVGGKSVPGSNSDPAFAALVGAGVDMYVMKDMAITVNDYNYITGNQVAGGGNTNVVMGGLRYDFK